MQNKFFPVLLFSVFTLLFLSCSEFDQYTTVGSDVVQDADPNLIDFDGNFLPLFMDSSVILEMKSLPSENESAFGRLNNHFVVGNENDISISAVTKFKLPLKIAKRLDTVEIDSVKFFIDTVKVLDTLDDATVNTSAYTITYDENAELSAYLFSGNDDDAPSADGEKVCTLAPERTSEDSDYQFAGTTEESALITAILEAAERYRDCDKNTAKDDDEDEDDEDCDSSVALSFFSDDSTIYWFASYPRMVIMSHFTDTTGEEDSVVNVLDTVYCSSRINVIESEELIEENSPQAKSVKLTGRTAVFALDLSAFWDSVSTTGFPEILSAAVVFDPEDLEITSDNTLDTMNVRFMLSSKYITDGLKFTDKINEAVSTYSATKTIHIESSDTLVFPVDYHLQNMLSDKPTKCYFYLQIVPVSLTGAQEILWPKPSFKAFLTTLK